MFASFYPMEELDPYWEWSDTLVSDEGTAGRIISKLRTSPLVVKLAQRSENYIRAHGKLQLAGGEPATFKTLICIAQDESGPKPGLLSKLSINSPRCPGEYGGLAVLATSTDRGVNHGVQLQAYEIEDPRDFSVLDYDARQLIKEPVLREETAAFLARIGGIIDVQPSYAAQT